MIYFFDGNERLIDFASHSNTVEALQEEEINSIQTLSLEIKSKTIHGKNMLKIAEEATYVGHKDMYDSQTFYLYRIDELLVEGDTFSIEAVSVASDELNHYHIIRDRRPSGSLSALLTSALKDTRWSVGQTDDMGTFETTFYYISTLEAVSKIVSGFGCEIRYRFVFDGNRITGRYVDALNELGGNTGKRFSYGDNAIKVSREENRSDLYTAYIGRGKGEEQMDDQGDSTENFTRRILFSDVVWEVSSGDPVDKPAGQDFVEIPELTSIYGFSDGSPRIGEVVFDEYEVGQEPQLLKATYEQLLEDSRPKVQFSTVVSKIGEVRLGDSVVIVRKDINYAYRTRIFKIKRNLLDDTATEVELGDKIDHGQESRRKQIKEKFDEIESTTASLVSTVQERLRENLFNRTAYTYDLRPGNQWGLPSGIWSFDAPIDEDPERVIYIGAGTMAVANDKLADGSWNFTTFATGSGLVADAVTSGTMLFDRLYGGTATLGGEGNGFGRLQVLDADGEAIADLDAERGGFSDLQVDDLVVTGSIQAPDVVMKQSEDVEYFIRGTQGDDDNSGVGDWDNALYSAGEAIRRLPKFIDGDVTLSFSNLYDISENVILDGFTGGGTITIDLRGNTFRGYIKTASCAVRIIIRDGEIDRESGTAYLIDNEGSTYVNITDMTLNGNGQTSGIRTWRNGASYITNTGIYNVDSCLRLASMGRIYVTSSVGLGNEYGLYLGFGTIAHVGTTVPDGVTAGTIDADSALIVGSYTHDSGTATPPAPPVTEKTETWTANSSGAWRPNFGGQWDAGSRSPSPYQGTWDGFGAYKGLWFFGNGMRDELSGATIKRIRVTVSRLSAGGNSSSVGVVFRAHNYASKPSGEPTLSNTSQSIGFRWGESKTFTLSSDFHSLFSNGNWRGLGIFAGASPYAIMGTSCSIEVTYES